MERLPDGYRLRLGSNIDRALLIKFLHQTYRELFHERDEFPHLAGTVNTYFSSETPLWWVDSGKASPIACLWMGQGIDQVSGDRYGHIFLLYVEPNHRRQGIATTLLHQAQTWVEDKGQQQIGLQVFCHNQAALDLYHHLGFQTQSLLMVKRL